MNTRKGRLIHSAGVSLELEVVEYLREVAARQERDRSYCINQIVREHAERNGQPLPPATRRPAVVNFRSEEE